MRCSLLCLLLAGCPGRGDDSDSASFSLGVEDGASSGQYSLRSFRRYEAGTLSLPTGASVNLPEGALPRGGDVRFTRVPDGSAFMASELIAALASGPYEFSSDTTVRGAYTLHIPLEPGSTDARVDLRYVSSSDSDAWVTLGALTVSNGAVDIVTNRRGRFLLTHHGDTTPDYVAPVISGIPAATSCDEPPCCPAFAQRVDDCGVSAANVVSCSGRTTLLQSSPETYDCDNPYRWAAPAGLEDALDESECRVVDNGEHKWARVCCPDGSSAKLSYGTNRRDLYCPATTFDAGVSPRFDAGVSRSDAGNDGGAPSTASAQGEKIAHLEGLTSGSMPTIGGEPPLMAWMVGSNVYAQILTPGSAPMIVFAAKSVNEVVDSLYVTRTGRVLMSVQRQSIGVGGVVSTQTVEQVYPSSSGGARLADHTIDLSQCISDSTTVYCGYDRLGETLAAYQEATIDVNASCALSAGGIWLCARGAAIYSVPPGGETETPIAVLPSTPAWLGVVGSTLYIFDGSTILYSVPVIGGDVQLFSNVAYESPPSFSVDSRNVYANGVRIPVDGSAKQSKFYLPYWIAESKNYLYRVEQSDVDESFDVYRVAKSAP